MLCAGSQDAGAVSQAGEFRGQVSKTVTVLNWGRSHLHRGVPRHVSDTRQAGGRRSTEELLPPAATEGQKMALDADDVADSSDASHVRLMAAVGRSLIPL